MVRPRALSYIGISQQWRASLTDGNSVTPAQVISIKVKDESINLTDLERHGRGYWADEVIATKRNEPNPTAVHIRFVTSLDGVLSRPVRDIGQGRSKT